MTNTAPTAGTYRTRPGKSGASPVVITWESYSTGRGWVVDLWVNGQLWEDHVSLDEGGITQSLSIRYGRAFARRVELRIAEGR